VPQVMKTDGSTSLIYIDLSDGRFALGGSSFAQVLSRIDPDVPDSTDPVKFKTGFNTIQSMINDGLIISGHDVSAGGLITCLLEMCFTNQNGGAEIFLDALKINDPIRLLFSEQPAVVIQVSEYEKVKSIFDETGGISWTRIGSPVSQRALLIKDSGFEKYLDINKLRDTWFKSSYLLDRLQSGEEHALTRYKNYGKQALNFTFPKAFSGKFMDQGIDPNRRNKSGIRAAIIREKGVNGDREMAYAMHLAGFDVKDVHMTDLITGREDLKDINFIVFVGGFSNSDVLGSAKGWAGAFLYNSAAREALNEFYAREDTISLGICNGCQVMLELDLIHPEREKHPKTLHNASGKFESAFCSVKIPKNESVMFKSLAGSNLGIWVAHGEGKFWLPEGYSYNKVAEFTYEEYPGNPNGSPEGLAAICSDNGRHLAMMPHPERAFLPWQWPYYPEKRLEDEMTPWLEAFVNAREWVRENQK